MSAYELHKFPTADLEAELLRRSGGEWRERESKPIPHCDECTHFVPYNAGEVPRGYNPCSMRHPMRFRVPRTMGDAHAGNWGFYRRGCKDRKSAEQANAEEGAHWHPPMLYQPPRAAP